MNGNTGLKLLTANDVTFSEAVKSIMTMVESLAIVTHAPYVTSLK